jgi:hypothetical protein
VVVGAYVPPAASWLLRPAGNTHRRRPVGSWPGCWAMRSFRWSPRTTGRSCAQLRRLAAARAPLLSLLKPVCGSRSDPRSGIVDALSTLVVDGTQLSSTSGARGSRPPAHSYYTRAVDPHMHHWLEAALGPRYDNEFGYCNRMLDVAKMVGTGLHAAE